MGVCVGTGVGVGVCVGAGVGVSVGSGDGVSVSVGVGVALRVGDAVGVGRGVDVAVGDGVSVGAGVAVAVDVAVGVLVASAVAVAVCSSVAVGAGLGLGVGAAVGVGALVVQAAKMAAARVATKAALMQARAVRVPPPLLVLVCCATGVAGVLGRVVSFGLRLRCFGSLCGCGCCRSRASCWTHRSGIGALCRVGGTGCQPSLAG